MGQQKKKRGLISSLFGGGKKDPRAQSPRMQRSASELPYKVWTSAEPIEYPDAMPGYVLAYHYDMVKAFPPWDLFKSFDLHDVADDPALGLRPEPDNKYDSNAVAIYWGRKKIGYVLKGRLQDMANTWLRRGWPVFASYQRGCKDGADSALFISLAFYKPEK